MKHFNNDNLVLLLGIVFTVFNFYWVEMTLFNFFYFWHPIMSWTSIILMVMAFITAIAAIGGLVKLQKAKKHLSEDRDILTSLELSGFLTCLGLFFYYSEWVLNSFGNLR